MPERQGFDVRIDDEIISYRGLSTETPYGLLRCVRGAHRTRKAPHKKGATVWHLTQRNNHYLVDCNNLDEAIEAAGKIPSAKFGSVEVRPLMVFDMPDS